MEFSYLYYSNLLLYVHLYEVIIVIEIVPCLFLSLELPSFLNIAGIEDDTNFSGTSSRFYFHTGRCYIVCNWKEENSKSSFFLERTSEINLYERAVAWKITINNTPAIETFPDHIIHYFIKQNIPRSFYPVKKVEFFREIRKNSYSSGKQTHATFARAQFLSGSS